MVSFQCCCSFDSCWCTETHVCVLTSCSEACICVLMFLNLHLSVVAGSIPADVLISIPGWTHVVLVLSFNKTSLIFNKHKSNI